MDLKPKIPTAFRLPKHCYLVGGIYTNDPTLLEFSFFMALLLEKLGKLVFPLLEYITDPIVL